jgi:putative acyl-CoA dehydrogenase
MPRLYREAPVNSIWEGSGNVISLDVLRAISREPQVVSVFMAEVEKARGGNANLDQIIDDLHREFNDLDDLEVRMRMITEMMALTLQGALLVQHAPAPVANAFCASRLAPRYRGAFGTLPRGCDLDAIIARATPG